ncbi:MAG: leucine-rich repeat domain-containing protein [Lachnospiraceae bacterium]|nr:leucine-rich repeat domain-containing protein [Lachnospiraceae bacterium]
MSGRRMRLAALLVAAAVCAAEVSAGSVTVSAEESQGQAGEESPDGQPDGGAREGEENIGCSYRVLEDGIVEITGYTGSEESISIPAQINGMKVAGIGDEAFYECEISGVTLPEGLVYIGDKAFQNSGVSSVSIPQSVEIIGEEAFYGSGLSSVSIPQSVETIGERAFARCGGLESVTFPNQLESLGKGAFERCKSLSSVTFGSGIKYIGDSAFDGCSALSGISLPEGLMGIGVCAFSQSGLSEITIPGSVENIGDRALWNCRNLSSATFSEGIKSIGESAFNRCNLTQVTLPDSLVSIGENAFSGCSLTSVTLPKSLVSLGGISASAEINVSPENSNYASYDGCLYNKDKTEILKCPSGKTEVTFPEGLQRIGAYAFSGCKDLTGVTLPEGLVSIGESAFSDCGRGQDSITIPSSVTDIAAGAFNDFFLSEIIVAPENSEYVSVDGCLYNKGKTKLLACPSNNRGSEDMKSFPEELTEIGAYAFSGCTVGSVTLPDGVTAIGDGAFSGCTVGSVTLPDGVTTIGDGAFSVFRINSGETKTITLPESVTHIGDGAFSGCGLSSITIPRGVTKIGKDTFSESDISSVTLPEGVTEIGDSAFNRCFNLASVTLPEGVTEIGAYAFNQCGELADVVIAGNMVNIGSYAFSESTNLNSVTISGSVANIGEFAFRQSGIQNFEIPEGLAVIGDDAFSYSGLCSISLPEGLTTIGSRTFEGCSSLASITIPASVTLFGADVFFQCGDLTINGNKEAEYLYRVLEDGTVELDKYNGSEENVVVPAQVNGKNVTSIGGSVFFEHGNLASVTLPDSLTKIGSSAFYECQRLTEITIPAGVTEIGTGAFMNCDNLKSISLPEGLKKLEDRLFSSSGISEIVIPESVECIGSSVFYNCFLDSLRIPANVTSIMHDAFSGCSLGAVDVAPENSRYVSEDGCLYDKKKTKILLCPQSKEEIALAESVTRIGSYAFGRSRMSSLTIPGSVESIGDNAFESSSLTSLSLPESVTSIGDEAFSMCYSLKCIAIPESVTFIGANAFESCRDLTIYGKEGSYAQTYASENHISFSTEEMPTPGEEKAIAAGDVTLSQSFYNYDGTEKKPEVTVVCDGAALEPGIDYTVSYSDNVEIGKAYAIIRGKGKYTGAVRKEFTIAKADEKDPAAEGFDIRDGMLYSYSGNAKEVIIPENVTQIKADAFDNCSSVTSLTIPKSVTLIDVNGGIMIVDKIPFRCGSLQEIKVDEENGHYASVDGILYRKDKKTLIRCPQGKSGKADIPQGVETVQRGAFMGCSSLTSIVFPQGLKGIDRKAFVGCGSLESVSLPQSLEYISLADDYAHMYCSPFAGCDSLKELKVDAGNQVYVFEDGILYNKEKTELVLCIPGKAEKITVPGNVAHIGAGAFAGYSGLTEIVIPSGVETIGKGAFFGSRNLASVSVPESVTEIGYYAFEGIDNLTIYGKTGSYAETYAKENEIRFSAEPQQPAEKKTISASDVSLSKTSYAYDGKAKKPGVTVRDGKTVLKKGTDYTVSYKGNVNAGTAKAIVTGKGGYEGSVTKTFTIAVKKGTSHKVGSYQYKVTGASTAELTAWKDKKAVKVKVLKEVKIGGKKFKVTAIGKNAFKNNKKITSVEMADNVKKIGASAFEGCAKLSKVTVGTGVTEIGASAFKNCKKLGNITVKSAKLKKVGKNALKGIKPTAKVKVPAKKLSAYQKLLKNKGQGKKVKIVK